MKNKPEQADQSKPSPAPTQDPSNNENTPISDEKVEVIAPQAQSPADELIVEPAESEDKRKVSQEDLDRCYSSLEGILGMGAAANWDEDDFDDQDLPELVDQPNRQNKSRSNRVMGIDIGETSVKLVQLGPKQNILTMDMVSLDSEHEPEERDRIVIQGIRSMMARNKIKTRRAVLCLSEKNTYVRNTALHEGSQSELQKVLTEEVGKQELPGGQGNYVFNHMLLENKSALPLKDGHAAAHLSALFFSTEREAVLRLVRIAKGAKLKVLAIDIDALAASRFFRQAYLNEQDETTVLAEMHAANTLLSFIKGDRLVWAKHLSTGSHEFTQSIAEALRIDPEEAEKLKRGEWKGAASVQNQKSDVIRALEPVLTRLSGEIRRTVQFYLSQEKGRAIHRIVLAGTGSRIPGVAKDLTRLLELPVVRWGNTRLFDFNSVVSSEEQLPDELSRFAIALGLCLWDKQADPINLLPGLWQRMGIRQRSKKEGTHRKTKIAIGRTGLPIGRRALLGGIAALLILGSGALFYAKNNGLKVRLEKEQVLQQDWHSVREDLDRLRTLRERVSKITAQVDTLRAQQIRLADGIAAFSKAVPRSVSLVSIRFEEARFTVSAYAVDTQSAQELIDRIKQSDDFTKPALGMIQKTDIYPGKKIYFELHFGLKSENTRDES